jgi:hypothetical protein
MALYGVETKLSPEEVIEKARVLFGEAGLGLEMAEQGPCCVTFSGGGGHVTVTASVGDKKTQVELETREWDHDVKRFMRALAQA